jgi:hypothetical protein
MYIRETLKSFESLWKLRIQEQFGASTIFHPNDVETGSTSESELSSVQLSTRKWIDSIWNTPGAIHLTQAQLSKIKETYTVLEFCAWVASNRFSKYHTFFASVSQLMQLMNSYTDALKKTKGQEMLWLTIEQALQQNKFEGVLLRRFLKNTFEFAFQNTKEELDGFVVHLEQNHLSVSKEVLTALMAFDSRFSRLSVSKVTKLSEDLRKLYSQKQLEQLISAVCIRGEIPAWFVHQKPVTIASLIHDLFASHPIMVQRVFQQKKYSSRKLVSILTHMNGMQFFKMLAEVYPSKKNTIQQVETLYLLLAGLSIRTVSGFKLQRSFLKQMLNVWIDENWSSVYSHKLLNTLARQLWADYKVEHQEVFESLESIENALPTSLKIAFKELKKSKSKRQPIRNKEETIRKVQEVLKKGISVHNAGLVILNSYIPILFDRLGHVEEGKFISTERQYQAIHHLQHVVTGLEETQESDLVLNKVLCGLNVYEPLPIGIEISLEEKELIEGMITSSIQHWSAIGDSSVEGFRGNWLVRDGILRELEEHWELTVAKRAYDILMNQSPFSFSIIKMPWMSKPLHVNWPY